MIYILVVYGHIYSKIHFLLIESACSDLTRISIPYSRIWRYFTFPFFGGIKIHDRLRVEAEMGRSDAPITERDCVPLFRSDDSIFANEGMCIWAVFRYSFSRFQIRTADILYFQMLPKNLRISEVLTGTWLVMIDRDVKL